MGARTHTAGSGIVIGGGVFAVVACYLATVVTEWGPGGGARSGSAFHLAPRPWIDGGAIIRDAASFMAPVVNPVARGASNRGIRAYMAARCFGGAAG